MFLYMFATSTEIRTEQTPPSSFAKSVVKKEFNKETHTQHELGSVLILKRF